MASSEPLPDDMLIEIMSRSRDVQTLAMMRTMSKQLNSESYTSKFTSIHSVSGFLLQFNRKNVYHTQFINSCAHCECPRFSISPFNFLPMPVKVLASSDATGLFYCESTEPRSMRDRRTFNHYVCKPATREWVQIPAPRTKNEDWFFSMRVGLVVISSCPLRYKIIRLCVEPCKGSNITSYKCQVLDSDAFGKWKLLMEPLKLEGGYFESLTSDPPVTVNGKLHFATTDSRVACFDPLLEMWEVFSMPDACHEDSLRPKLTKHKGKLGLLLDQRIQSVLFWVMDDYHNKVWTERSSLCPEVITGSSESMNLLGFCSSETVLFQNRYDIVMQSLEKNGRNSGTMTKRKIEQISIDSVFELRSDVERLGWKTETDAKRYMARKSAKITEKMIQLMSRSNTC